MGITVHIFRQSLHKKMLELQSDVHMKSDTNSCVNTEKNRVRVQTQAPLISLYSCPLHHYMNYVLMTACCFDEKLLCCLLRVEWLSCLYRHGIGWIIREINGCWGCVFCAITLIANHNNFLQRSENILESITNVFVWINPKETDKKKPEISLLNYSEKWINTRVPSCNCGFATCTYVYSCQNKTLANNFLSDNHW